MNTIFEEWAKTQFEGLNLGDKRLNKRAQLIAGNMMRKPSASINMQSENWSESKGAYRFFDSEKVSFQELIKPHTESVKFKANSLELVLAIQDTCYISYGHHPSVTDLGHIGAEETSGVILHNTLAVNPSSNHPSVIGVLDQWIHNRKDMKDDDWTETKLWQEASSRINIDVTKTKVVEVMDREGAVFDIMKHSLSLGHEFLIRTKSNKYVRSPFRRQIIEAGSKVTVVGHIEIEVQKKEGQKKRKAKLEEEIASAEAQSQDATDLEANIEAVNAQLKVISDLKAKLDAATTKEEVKALTKEIKTTWKGIKSDLEGSRGTIMTHKFAFAVSRSKSLEAKLDRVLEKLKSEGKDVSSVQPKVDSFKAHIARAKELIEQARTKFADKSETSVKQGHELLVQAHQELKLAHSDLKEIVASFRAKGGAKVTEELEVSETDVSATTSTDTTSSSDTSTSDTQTTAVTGAVTVDLSSSESDNTVSTEVTTSTETTTYSTSTASAGCPFTEPTATCGTSLDSVETSSDTVPGVEEDTA